MCSSLLAAVGGWTLFILSLSVRKKLDLYNHFDLQWHSSELTVPSTVSNLLIVLIVPLRIIFHVHCVLLLATHDLCFTCECVVVNLFILQVLRCNAAVFNFSNRVLLLFVLDWWRLVFVCSIQHLWPATGYQSHPNWFPDSKGRMGTRLTIECNDIIDIVATMMSSVTLETCHALH